MQSLGSLVISLARLYQTAFDQMRDRPDGDPDMRKVGGDPPDTASGNTAKPVLPRKQWPPHKQWPTVQ
ncbi:MAG: hypothetical protein AAF638_06375 [Pseudomonadota bacterium]